MPSSGTSTTFSHKDWAETLANLGYYPQRPKFNLEGWLRNFLPHERPLAECLASRFIFISEEQGEAMFLDCIHNLSSIIPYDPVADGSRYAAWEQFLDDLIITRVTGETPNDTDSGFSFQRWARTLAGIDQNHILSPSESLSACLAGNKPLLLVDDFLGSGDQIIRFWNRKFNGISLNDLFKGSTSPAYYCPLFATSYGMARSSGCDGLNIIPVHILDDRYKITNPDSIVWRGLFSKDEIHRFLDETFSRANFTNPFYKYGYHDLSLAIGLWNNVPDATIQIIWDESPLWKPLIKRS